MTELHVDINCDMGESFGRYRLGNDRELLKLISSANVACGYHAGDPSVMRRTVRWAAAENVAVGAHPGFPDLVGFGRRNMQIDAAQLRDLVLYQVGALESIARSEGVRLQHVKPHGAMYNMAVDDIGIAGPIAAAVASCSPELILFGMAGSALERAAKQHSLRFAREAFADRTYQADGRLTPRSVAGAVVEDPDIAADRAVEMVLHGRVRTADGSPLAVPCDTICLHGDNPRALDFARQLHRQLQKHAVSVVPVSQIVR